MSNINTCRPPKPEKDLRYKGTFVVEIIGTFNTTFMEIIKTRIQHL